jgi:ActR/RegA family two-component response regulator
MRPINVVLAHHDAVAADRLAASLGKQFRNLAIAKSAGEIAPAVARLHAPFAVVDLELVDFSKLKSLCAQFPGTAFVCIHRLADDRMWSDALAMGAVDCCHSSDVQGILLASERYVVLTRSRSAAA